MHKRTRPIFLAGLVLLLAAAMTGCRIPISGETPVASLTPSSIATIPIIPPLTAPVLIITHPTALTTQPATQGYPQPVLTSTAPQTQAASPFPSPTSQPVPTEAIPTTIASATQPPANLPEASPTPQEPTAVPTSTESPLPEYPGPEEYVSPLYPGPEETEYQLYPGPEETETQPIPGLQETNTEAYPGPQFTSTPRPTSMQTTSTPKATQTGSKGTLTSIPGGTVFPSPSPSFGTGTPGATPTELPPRRPLSPPPAGSNVSIWYSWNTVESEMLRSIVQSFQKLYPDVTFTLNYVPRDDLFTDYQEVAYLGQGPSLLLGPAQWGPELYQGQLVADLDPYIPYDYLSGLNPAALASARYHASLVSLPLSQHGVVMFRNTDIIANVPQTMDELSTLSHSATHAGVVGSYLERGAYFSSAGILGMGGTLMDDDQMPAFNDLAGVAWINLLAAYDDAGAVTFNTNRDLDMFKRGRVGIVIDGTWNIAALTKIIGADKLAIDAWPSFGNGHMSGWVEADSVFLNSNVTGNDRFAALAFMGYLLNPDVQLRLAEVGHIPSVMATKPRDPLIQQAMIAFLAGVPYPITVDENTLNLYFNVLNMTIRDVFANGISPEVALKSASNEITQILTNLPSAP
jgi:multiple sugar transport system substrate-binding protein